ncbi:hypothetical protein VMT65_31130 [Nocardia sp. CDC153]|uniref:hypothetical protein n=1 Tax=Nocardia sp. CDC153 TaxID=3112167 RepID=UPI002DBAB11C|nr:hypothetical protein [Nocardia sp. CDC153]MEC3957523.1 hypothetical protein [Nocardia sp. CDC153]
MTGFALSSDRRDELAALLGDEKRFQTSYPKVADYLATAPGLPGTGDVDVDQGFDIRLLHYMTGGESSNPYWDIVAPLVSEGPVERNGRLEINGGRPGGSARLAYAQMALQAAYAYAVPSPSTVRWVRDICDGRGLLEIGAGRGYWAYLLDQIGLDVMAFDSEPPDATSNVSFPESAGLQSVWFPVGGLDELQKARGSGEEADRVLFLCWPPGWGDPMALDALNHFADAGGERLIYIGELRGGKTGTDEFFDALAADWTLDGQDASFVSWWNLGDVAQTWIRRT